MIPLLRGTVGTHTLDFIPPHKMVIELPEELVAKVMSFTSDMARLFALEARRKGLLMSNSAKNPENIKEAKETLVGLSSYYLYSLTLVALAVSLQSPIPYHISSHSSK